jgi:hypothetical protein
LGSDEIGFVTGDGTRLRAAPQRDATSLRTFDWEPAALLPFANETSGSTDLEKQWAHVRALDGSEGYVERANVTTSYDLRAVFERRNGRWVISAFVSGD